jgi:hypothetical protein
VCSLGYFSGTSYTRPRASEGATDVIGNVSVAFTDAQGAHWRRNGFGELRALSRLAMDDYGGRDDVKFNWL